jgi:hypothetical protein
MPRCTGGIENMKKTTLNRPDVQQNQASTGWRDYANPEEVQRLEVLDGRIEGQRAILRDTVKDRMSIRSRLIRRMRRATGKE